MRVVEGEMVLEEETLRRMLRERGYSYKAIEAILAWYR